MFGPGYFETIPRLGVGLGVNLDDVSGSLLASTSKRLVDYFEVSAEDIRRSRVPSYQEVHRKSASIASVVPTTIDELNQSHRVVIHSTNVNPVYPDVPDADALETLRRLLDTTGSPWFTEDPGIWLMDGRHVYPYFMQFPMTADTLAVTIENVRRIQEIVGRPFNAEFPPMGYVLGDLNAFEFFRVLTAETGCGMTIDVGHILSYQLTILKDRGYRG
jgi:uncharacterized protein (UPF0276 family)